MCGRITCYLAPDDLSCACKYKDVSGKELEVPWVPQKFQSFQYSPSYNMGPRDTVACVVAGSHFNNESERVLCPMVWGMIPPWHKGEYRKHTATTHNGRLEGLNASKLYGKPLNQGKRCSIVISGFYEWLTDKKSGSKQPHYIFKKSEDGSTEERVLNLAGLFDKWISNEGETIYSCTILTTAVNDVLSWLHHRAPVILQSEEIVQDWLDYKKVSANEALNKLQSSQLLESTLKWHPVSSTVNNVRNKDTSCIEPIKIEKEKKKLSKGMMSTWLTTGSMNSKKRQSSEPNDQDADEVCRTAKILKRDG